MAISEKDRDILRELAKETAEIAALPQQQETIRLWKAHNALKPERPMVMIDQICWHEMNVDDELTLQTEDAFCQSMETDLRRNLYAWKHMPADMVIESVIDIGKTFHSTGFGIEVDEDQAVLDPQNSVVGHAYNDQLATEDDLAKMHAPEITPDPETTAAREEIGHEIFDGILEVRLQGEQPMFSPWDRIVTWRGAENVLYDMAARPEFMHAIVDTYTNAILKMLDQYEEHGLLGHSHKRIHCTGAHSDDLPSEDFDPARPQAKDIWTYGQAQIFGGVSPEMHREFDIQYAAKWYARFGLGYYGCCEALDRKMDIVRELPNVRKVSMSPWADAERGAEAIAGEFVFSNKPNPAFLAWDRWAPDHIEKELTAVREACDRHNCPLEFIQKDISTVRYEPQRLWEWSEIALRVAQS